MAELIRTMPEGAIALLLEPGNQSNAGALMEWRRSLVEQGDFTRTGPCGQELLIHPIEACTGCWNAQRQSFHQTALYFAFRQTAEKFLADKRSFDNFENNLLSWSSVWIKRGQSTTAISPINRSKYICRNELMEKFRYIGRYQYNQAADPNPDNEESQKVTEWKEYIKLCPMSTDGPSLTFERPAGFVAPILKHGQEIRIVNGIRTYAPDGTAKIQVNTDTRMFPLIESVPGNVFVSEYSDRTRVALTKWVIASSASKRCTLSSIGSWNGY